MATFYCSAQSLLQFQHFTQKDGYSEGIVTHLFQDQYGFIWIGTADGLFRYDGYQFKEFRAGNDPGSIVPGNVITDLLQDQEGYLWIGSEGGGCNRINLIDGSVRAFRMDPANPAALSSNIIEEIYADRAGNIWIGYDKEGLSVYNPALDSFAHYANIPGNATSLGKGGVNEILQDSSGNIWIALEGGGLNRYLVASDNFQRFVHIPGDTASLLHNEVQTIFEDSRRRLWIGTKAGLQLLDPQNGAFIHAGEKAFSALRNASVRSLAEDQDGNLWIGTTDGLFALNWEQKTMQIIRQEIGNSNSLRTNHVMRLLADQQGGIWVGTWGAALSRLNLQKQKFNLVISNPHHPNTLTAANVKSIFESPDSILWIGTSSGLFRIDQSTGERKLYQTPLLTYNNILSIWQDHQGFLWIGTSRGLNRLNPHTEEVLQFRHREGDSESLPHDQIWSIFQDNEQRLWIGTAHGLSRFMGLTPSGSGRFQTHLLIQEYAKSHSVNQINAIYQDRAGNLWVGTYGGGLNIFNPEEATFSAFVHSAQDSTSIINNVIWTICEDYLGGIWVGTPRGMSRLDRQKGVFTHIQEKDGLPNNFVFGILEDTHQRLWVSTNRGLFRYHLEDKTFRVYDIQDGLQHNEFNQGAYFRAPVSGRLYFGGVRGLNSFIPEEVQDNEFIPPIVFTRFNRHNFRESPDTPISDIWLQAGERLNLSYRDNILEFEFASLNFTFPQKNRYAYRLSGFSNQWVPLGTTNKITFTNLDPGFYQLTVKGSNNDGKWNEEGITIEMYVRPPWYQTWWAYLLFALLLTCSIYSLYRFQVNRQLAEQEAKRLAELNAVKNKFYTNITHEFRTPLTVIMGMLATIKDNLEAKEIIRRNSEGLLKLVNQILDLRKLEVGKMPLSPVQADVVRYLQNIFQSFVALAKERNVQLHFLPSEQPIIMDFDPDKLLRIVSNLLSNAIKYNREGGQVYLQLDRLTESDQEYLLIRVKDTGIGIAENELPFIFQRFYQSASSVQRLTESLSANNEVGTGTGVGLALTKELVHLKGGTIKVKSEVGGGSSFVVTLPIHVNAPKVDLAEELWTVKEPLENWLSNSAISISSTLSSGEPENKNRELILVVEDNQDVAFYLKNILQKDFRVEVCVDGEAGIKTAISIVPDIIVSDIMMPKKDGYELVATLKADERTSHIPIILLTAKVDSSSRLEGLEKGADVYLSKPFYPSELLLRIQNLLQLRKQFQKRYQRALAPVVSDDPAIQQEDLFLKKIHTLIEAHLKQDSYGIAELCKSLGLSRTQLHHKIKALTGRSTSLYLRSIRLGKAKKLLQNSGLSIAEVAYEVGFKDPNYFTRTFSEEFGVTPSKLRKE